MRAANTYSHTLQVCSRRLLAGTLTAVVVLLLSSQSSTAQTVDVMTKLRLAQGFEQSGDYERSVVLYEELFNADPTNFIFFDGLKRGYVQLKQYDKAVRVLKQRLETQPNDIQLMASLGGLYFDMGEDRRADSLWQALITSDPRNVGITRVVASQMMEHRLFDRVVQVFLSARSMSGNELAFTEELASLYSAMQQYRDATKEYVRLLRSSPSQLSLVQTRIASYTIREEGVKAASVVVSEEVRRSPDDVALRRLLAWLSMEEKDYRSAFSQYQIIDKLTNAKGNEIFVFAQRASQERAFGEAALAFQEVAEKSANPVLLPQARFGFARAMEEISVETDTATGFSEGSEPLASGPVSETRPGYEGTIRLYQQIVEHYPNSALAAQAMFRIGMIRFERFFDLDGAIASFERARRIPPISNLTYDAALEAGKVQVSRNNLKEARREFEEVARAPFVEYQDKAAFKLAEVDYFESLFDSSLSRLKRFSSNVGGDLANDALQLTYFIQENKTTAGNALTEFARADLLVHQRKYSEAMIRFKDIVAAYSSALLLDDALMKIAELQLLLRQTFEGLATFQRVITDSKLSILKDKAQMRVGETYQNILKDNARAIAAYEELLMKYPHSLYSEEARKRIRLLRGDSI